MNGKIWMRWLNFYSENLKSKIGNLKWVARLAILVMLAGWVRVAEAQQPQKVPRIGYISATDPTTDSTRSEAIRLALRELDT